MPIAKHALSANEAASVTGVPLKQVHRIVDAGLLEGAVETRDGARVFLGGRSLVGLTLAYQTADLLTPNGRRRLVRQVLQKPRAAKVAESALSVDVRPIESAIRSRRAALERARRTVTVDPDVMDGAPCLKGMRIPVHDIAAMIANGDERSAVLKAYPQLTRERIDLAVLYAEAHPRRGRPRRRRSWRNRRPSSSRRMLLHDLPPVS